MALLAELHALGVLLKVESGQLRFHPSDLVSEALLGRMREWKADLIALLEHPENLENLEERTIKTIKRSGLTPSEGFDGSPGEQFPIQETFPTVGLAGSAFRPVTPGVRQFAGGRAIKTIRSLVIEASKRGAAAQLPSPDRIAPAIPCRLCGRTRLWRLPEVTTWWCAACLPCCLPEPEVVWAEAGANHFESDPPQPASSAPGAPKLDPEGAHG